MPALEATGEMQLMLCLPFFILIRWIVGIGDLENIHYSRVSNAPMNL